MTVDGDGELPGEVRFRDPFLDVALRVVDGVVEISMDGEIDLASAEALMHVTRRVDELIRSDGHRPASVLVDMSGIEFCDGSGVAFLVGLQLNVAAAGSRFAVGGASPVVRRLLDILDLNSLLENGGS
jgi:anti-sigma B factor antagonist